MKTSWKLFFAASLCLNISIFVHSEEKQTDSSVNQQHTIEITPEEFKFLQIKGLENLSKGCLAYADVGIAFDGRFLMTMQEFRRSMALIGGLAFVLGYSTLLNYFDVRPEVEKLSNLSLAILIHFLDFYWIKMRVDSLKKSSTTSQDINELSDDLAYGQRITGARLFLILTLLSRSIYY